MSNKIILSTLQYLDVWKLIEVYYFLQQTKFRLQSKRSYFKVKYLAIKICRNAKTGRLFAKSKRLLKRVYIIHASCYTYIDEMMSTSVITEMKQETNSLHDRTRAAAQCSHDTCSINKFLLWTDHCCSNAYSNLYRPQRACFAADFDFVGTLTDLVSVHKPKIFIINP